MSQRFSEKCIQNGKTHDMFPENDSLVSGPGTLDWNVRLYQYQVKVQTKAIQADVKLCLWGIIFLGGPPLMGPPLGPGLCVFICFWTFNLKWWYLCSFLMELNLTSWRELIWCKGHVYGVSNKLSSAMISSKKLRFGLFQNNSDLLKTCLACSNKDKRSSYQFG